MSGSADTTANLNANNYTPTAAELSTFHSVAPSWTSSVNGQCPQGLTTGELIQYVACTYGINPQLLMAQAVVETGGNNIQQSSLGDQGRSCGIFQVAFKGANHGWFGNNENDLPCESTCVNGQFVAAHLIAAYNGQTGEVPAGNLNLALGSWYDGSNQSGDLSYAQAVCTQLSDQGWNSELGKY
jgi:hypothetical protein